MRIFRSKHFWLSIGSIAFVFLMSVARNDFWTGFLTACFLAFIWYAADYQKHREPSQSVPTLSMDHESGELRLNEPTIDDK